MHHTLPGRPVSGTAVARSPLSGFGRIRAFIQRIGLVIRHRLEMRELAQFDERMLKDIGLTGSDVQGALSEPWHKDPSRMLRIKSVQHRALTWAHTSTRAR